mgnify:FL=1
MTEIIPRQDTKGIDSFLAGAMPVARFVIGNDELGDETYSLPRFGGGILCGLKVRDPNARGFLATRKAIKQVRDLNPMPYKTLEFEVDGEGDFNIKSLSELFGMIPVEEKRRLAYFEPVYAGLGVHGERLAEIRLYQRAK